jgi:hypothetical protein
MYNLGPILIVPRSLSIILFDGDITALRICMTLDGTAGIGIPTVSISGHTPRIFQVS